MGETKELANLRSKTERFMREVTKTYSVVDDRYRIQHESTALFIEPVDLGEERTILRMRAVVLAGVPRRGNDSMFEEFSVLNNRYIFGKLYWVPTEDDGSEGIIFLEHNFLGEMLDFEEFVAGVVTLSSTSDELDDKLQSKYGGRRWVD
ncbi:MAG: hypothetical protein P9L99_11610 [Candidatus Lernaella stagnicola]|nr:hypothetical protein [Candidatus Lernaella stagnicola]